MNKSKTITNYHLYLGLLIWLSINLIQTIFTEINPDEAYYAFWAERLAFGYFDHPPMVSVIIRISSLLFDGNLGVRLVTLILQPLTMLITWKLCDTNNNMPLQKRLFIFFVTASAMTMFIAYGFFTTPDVPLLFFTSLFLYAYKNFLNSKKIHNTLLLTLAMAGLVYSKYQGVIVIILLLLSNLRLLKNPQFLLSATMAFILSLPHFFWQIKNNFPSFQYHLVGRSKEFNWSYFFEYIPNQLATFNPFVFGAMIWVLFKYRVSNLFERALVFIITGLILFFWICTYKGHAEPHWTVAASIPALILIVNFSSINEGFFNYIKRFVGASLILILIIRILLMTNLLPPELEFSGKKARYLAIEKIAENTPVVFTGSFQSPSLYHFFTGKTTTLISSLSSRQTQFDIWKNERQLQGKKVFLVGEYGKQTKEYKVNSEIFKGFFIQSFQSTRDLNITFQDVKTNYACNETVKMLIEIENNGQFPVLFHHPELPLNIAAIISGKNVLEIIEGQCSEDILSLNPGEKKKLLFSFVLPRINSGAYKMGYTCKNIIGASLNSRLVNISLSQ